jgi:hypothetical protein
MVEAAIVCLGQFKLLNTIKLNKPIRRDCRIAHYINLKPSLGKGY